MKPFKIFSFIYLYFGLMITSLGILVYIMQDGQVDPTSAGIILTACGVLLVLAGYFGLLDCVKWSAGVLKPKTWSKRIRVYLMCKVFGLHRCESQFIYSDPVQPERSTLLGYREICTRCGEVLNEKVY